MLFRSVGGVDSELERVYVGELCTVSVTTASELLFVVVIIGLALKAKSNSTDEYSNDEDSKMKSYIAR